MARVFKMKKDQLLDDIMKCKVFVVVQAHLWVIEFQREDCPMSMFWSFLGRRID